MTLASLSALAIGAALALAAEDGTGAPAAKADQAEGGVALRSKAELGQTTKIKRTLTAEGTIRASSGDAKLGIPATPLKLKVEAKVEYDERPASISPDGTVAKSARRFRNAAVRIGGDVRESTLALRPKVATVVAERRGREVFLYSNGGPLTRQEYDLIRGPGDRMAWTDFAPENPVKVGESWEVGEATARELSDYDALSSNTLKGTLESADESTAKVRFRGAVRGSLAGEGTISIAGLAVFDRKAGLIKHLVINRNEVRGSGPVETALEMKSTLTVEAEPVAQTPSDLDNPTLASLPAKPPSDWELLLYEAPNKKYVLRHSRDWHLFWDDAKIAVFKRLDNGELVAQCNIAEGPNAGPGKHQDVKQFLADIKKALGARFVQVLGEGEVAASPGLFLYKVGVEGKESVKVEGKDAQVAVDWFYYLVASPRGDQLLLTFTLGQAQAKAFADGDEALAKGLEWLEPPAK